MGTEMAKLCLAIIFRAPCTSDCAALKGCLDVQLVVCLGAWLEEPSFHSRDFPIRKMMPDVKIKI